MTTSPLTAGSLLAPVAGAAPHRPAAPATAALSPTPDAIGGLDGSTVDPATLLGSVNALQSLASLLGGGQGAASASAPTIPPRKPIDPVDQKTVRDSIPEADASPSAAA
jgi:hypothetical protein